MELNENELENVLGGAKREVVNDKVEENRNLYRGKTVAELEREIEELKAKRAEIVENHKSM